MNKHEQINRVLIIGWDGATWDYINPLLADNRLPNLARLLDNGARATLRSTIPPYTNIAWPALVTGTRPNKTGVYDGARALPNSYETVPTNLTGFRGVSIWQWVNEYGRTAGVLNVPMTYPAQPVDGYLISGFDSPANADDIAWPRHILNYWTTEGWPYHTLAEEIRLMSGQNPNQKRLPLADFVAGWETLTHDQGKMAAWLWRTHPVDLMFIVFSGTDSINHRTHEFEQIARIYTAADEALGTLLSVVEEDTLICLVSDHGSTPAHRYIALNRILYEAGWLAFRPEIARRFWQRLPGVLGQVLPNVWQSLPGWARRLISAPVLRYDGRFAIGSDNLDWPKTQVFARSSLGPLYINLEGRQPRGCVPEEAYEALCEAVRLKLLGLRDENGRSLFRQVWRTRELFPHTNPEDDVPDLIAEPANWHDHMITGYPTDPIVRPIPADAEYGTHTPDGILVLHGPGVRKGVLLETADIVDVVPTLLTAWGLPVPDACDGRVLQAAFTEELAIEETAVSLPDQYSHPQTAEHAAEIIARLRALGYLE